MMDIKDLIKSYVEENRDELIRISSELVRIPSEDPPSDTHAMVDYLINEIKDIEGVTYRTYTKVEPKISLLAWLKGKGEGKKLVFNGHIDTFLVGSTEGWIDDPFSGAVRDGKVYGRGSCDMKAAIAGYVIVMKAMAKYKDYWNGEICFTFASDEESAGIQGTEAILEEIPEALGDAMINGDVGSPQVLKFGEKGFLDMQIIAKGKAAHGLHKYKGINAIDRLIKVLMEIEELEKKPIDFPKIALDTILAGKKISESVDMPGEVENMQHLTVNVGQIEGGYIYSTIPANASAQITIGIPIGSSLVQIREEVLAIIAKHEGITYKIYSQTEPNWTDPTEEIFGIMKEAAQEVTGLETVISLRSGFDDSRFYRYKGIPAVLLGVTEHAMGDANEYFEIEDMVNVTKIYALTAIGFLA